jgi:hypothetical protein
MSTTFTPLSTSSLKERKQIVARQFYVVPTTEINKPPPASPANTHQQLPMRVERYTPLMVIHPNTPDIPHLRNANVEPTNKVEVPADLCDPSVLKQALGIPSGEIYRKVLTAIGEDTTYDTNHPICSWPNSGRAAVIVDTRYDTVMKGVIRNFMYHMNPHGWNLIIVGCAHNKAKIEKDFPACQFMPLDPAVLTRTDTPNEFTMSIAEYNKLMKNPEFWRKLPKKLVVFQRDCFLYKMFPDYMVANYSYIGANFYATPSPVYGGLNGGLSYRNRDDILECIERVKFASGNIPDSITRLNEDVYFTHALEHLKKCLPDKIARSFFSIEIDMNTETCGYHGWHHNYHPTEFALYMLAKSPFAREYLAKVL